MLSGIQKKDPGTWRPSAMWSAKCTGVDVRLFVTSTKLYSSHQHRISDVGTLTSETYCSAGGLIRWDPQRFGAVRDLRSSLACADVPGFNPDRAWDADALVALFPFQSVHAIGSKLLWGFLVIECLFEEFRGILSLYTSTQLQQAVVAKLAERFLGSSSQDNTAQLRARHQTWAWATNRFDILGLSGGKDNLAILMHKQVPQMEYFFCDTTKE